MRTLCRCARLIWLMRENVRRKAEIVRTASIKHEQIFTFDLLISNVFSLSDVDDREQIESLTETIHEAVKLFRRANTCADEGVHKGPAVEEDGDPSLMAARSARDVGRLVSAELVGEQMCCAMPARSTLHEQFLRKYVCVAVDNAER